MVMVPAFLFQLATDQAELSVRTHNALNASGRYPTLGHLAQTPDNTLLMLPGMGRKGLKEIREVIKNVTEGPLSGDDLIVTWALSHKLLVQALITGEAIIVPRVPDIG
jgi:hypothetical protein